MQREPPTKLATLHAHERDPYITFDEGPHIYTVKGDSSFTSVTTWLGSHFSHFDADAIINKMMLKCKICSFPKRKFMEATEPTVTGSVIQMYMNHIPGILNVSFISLGKKSRNMFGTKNIALFF